MPQGRFIAGSDVIKSLSGFIDPGNYPEFVTYQVKENTGKPDSETGQINMGWSIANYSKKRSAGHMPERQSSTVVTTVHDRFAGQPVYRQG